MKNFIVIIFTVLIAVCLQFWLTYVDSVDTPNKAATEFIKAYYSLDPSMAERLCEKPENEDGLNIAEQYIDNTEKDAQLRGFARNYMKFRIFKIKTRTNLTDDKNAEVILSGKRDRSIRFFFPFVARLFFIGEVYDVAHNLKLTKENDKWKVCDFEFSG